MARLKEALCPEFNSPEELQAHYAAMRARLYGKTAVRPVVLATPQLVAARTRARLVRTVYDEPVGPVDRGWRTIYAEPIGPLFLSAMKVRKLRSPTHARYAIKRICNQHKVPVADVLSPARFRHLTSARREICCVLFYELGFSASAIARMIGRDRTSVSTLIGKRVRP